MFHGSLAAWKGCFLYAVTATAIWSLVARRIGDRAAFVLAMVPGVFLHELLHFLVGLITNAKPSSFSIIPNRVKAGSVSFTNLAWYNAIPTALAPLLGLLFVSVAAAQSLPAHLRDLTGQNALLLLILSPLAYACWPSSVDWKLSLRGWPIYLGGVVYMIHIAT